MFRQRGQDVSNKTMKFEASIIFFMFLFVGIFGFSSLAHESHTAHHSCLFSFSSTCAQAIDPIDSALEHLSSLQGSLQANVAPISIPVLLLLVFFLITAALVLKRLKLEVFKYLQKSTAQFFRNIFNFKNSFLAWLSVLNNRDPLVMQTAR